MSKSAWPTASEVAASLPSSISNALADDYVAAIVQEVCDRTGYSTFLGSGSAVRYFTPPDYRSGQSILELLDGLIACTEVRVDYHGTGDTGTALTLGSDYNLLPFEAADLSRPWTRILFIRSSNAPFVFGSIPLADPTYTLKTVKITGTWGYSAAIPTDLWMAVRNMAAAQCVIQARRGTGQLTTLKDDDVTLSYDSANALCQAETKQLERMIQKYMRVY